MTIARLLGGALLLTLIGCDAGGGPSLDGDGGERGTADAYYVVHLFEGVDTDAGSWLEVRMLDAEGVGGLPLGPLRIVGDLDSPALPPTASSAWADWLWIVRFDDLENARAFGTTSGSELVTMGGSPVVFIGATPTELAVFPPIENLGRADDPAFVLVNAITLRDGGQEAFSQYSAEAVPRVMGEGTEFSAPLSPIEVLQGDFRFHFLALTRWTDLTTFHEVHAEPAFLDLVRLRNGAVADFLEAEARPIR